MDSDCLIKITRAGLKEAALGLFETTCPEVVRDEVVRQGARKPESNAVEQNIESGALRVCPAGAAEGDEALVEAFNTGQFDVVATDDRRLIRRLDPLGIPCVVPGLLLHGLVAAGRLTSDEGLESLERLRPMVGADEYHITKFLLTNTPREASGGR